MNLAELVASRREALGLSLRQVAEKSGGVVSSSTLNEIERGLRPNVSDRILEGIADALNVSLSKVRTAAGVSARDLGPFYLERADRLNARERRLVQHLVDALLAAHREDR